MSSMTRSVAAMLILIGLSAAESAAEGLAAEWAEILPFSSWTSRASTLTEDGWLQVEPGEEGAGLVCAGGHDLGITCQEQFLRVGEQIDPPRLSPGVALRGRVLIHGEAADGVRVALVPAELAARRPVRLPLGFEDGDVERELVTDSRGHFETPPLASSTYRLELIPPGGRIELLEPFVVPAIEDFDSEHGRAAPASTAALDLGDLELTPGLPIEFSVIDEAGVPVAKAVVSASQGKSPAPVTMFESRTDSEGRAIMHGFEPSDPIETACFQRGFARLEQRFQSPPAWIECVLQPLARLTGEVRYDGEGAPDATVSLPGRRRWIKTDSAGRFELLDVEPGAFRLEVAAPGFQVAECKGTLAPGQNRAESFDLVPAPQRWGQVVDAATGEPISGAQVVSIAPRGAVAEISNSEGELFFETASNQPIALEVNARGYPSHRSQLEPKDGLDDVPWVAELERGGRLDVAVWSSASDGPCVGCDLVIVKAVASGEPPPPVSLRTGVDGKAASEELAAGPYRVYLEEARSLGSAVHVRSGHNVKLAEIRSGAVTEVVFGEPQQEVEIWLRPLPGPDWRLRSVGTRDQQTHSPESDGSFHLRRRPGEVLRLRLEAKGVSVSQGMLAAESGDLVYLDLPTALVTGRLVQVDGAPRALGLSIRPMTPGGATAWVAPEAGGGFAVPFLPAGSYLVLLDRQRLATFELGQGQHLELGELSAQEDRRNQAGTGR